MPKTGGFGALFDVQMSKKGAALWREAHLEVKSDKICGFSAFFDVQMSKKSLTLLIKTNKLTNLPILTDLTNLTN